MIACPLRVVASAAGDVPGWPSRFALAWARMGYAECTCGTCTWPAGWTVHGGRWALPDYEAGRVLASRDVVAAGLCRAALLEAGVGADVERIDLWSGDGALGVVHDAATGRCWRVALDGAALEVAEL